MIRLHENPTKADWISYPEAYATGMSVTLIMPVHMGGEKFRECLRSIENHIHQFETVVISLNSGNVNSVDENIIYEILGKLEDKNVVVLKQPKVLRPTKHLFSLLSHSTFRFYKPDNPIMLLFHDDLIKGDELDDFLGNQRINLKGRVVFGPWEKRSRNNPDSLHFIESLTWGPQTSDSLLRQNSIRPSFTNTSGMIAPFGSLRDYADAFLKSEHGARMEWALVASKHSKQVISSHYPLVSILDHPEQAGKKLSYLDYQKDEIRFQLLMLRSGRLRSLKLLSLFTVRVAWAFMILCVLSIIGVLNKSCEKSF